MNFEWQPKQLDKEEFGVIELKLKNAWNKIVLGKEAPAEEVEEVKEEKQEIKDSSWVKSVITRLP